MKKKLMMVSLLLILVTGLSTSSFFLPDYLSQTITDNKHTRAQLNFALKHQNIAALKFAMNHTTQDSKQWLLLTEKLAKTEGEAAYQLGFYYQDIPDKAVFWLKTAIKHNYHGASIALAQRYFQQDKLTEAADVLVTLPDSLAKKIANQVNILKINIAINQGKLVEVHHIINQHKQQLQQTTSGQLLLNEIKKYRVLSNKNHVIEISPISLSCRNSIQLFATTLNHLKHVEKLVSEFNTHPLKNTVCFAPPRYMAINELDCTQEQDKAIRCNELDWQARANTINSRYVALMLPRGGANVHLGILYFDAQDSVDVLSHEISHLLGFVDEYPLVAEHVKCRVNQEEIFAQNISVLNVRYQGEQQVVRAKILKQLAWAEHIKKSTPILQAIIEKNGEKYWQLGTPEIFNHEIGVFKAKTCDNGFEQKETSFSAFKPLSIRTKLQYFALSFPPLYLALLQEDSTQYSMPSFHYNIALAYFQQAFLQQDFLSSSNIKQSYYWLEQAANNEHEVNRQKKIRQGDF